MSLGKLREIRDFTEKVKRIRDLNRKVKRK